VKKFVAGSQKLFNFLTFSHLQQLLVSYVTYWQSHYDTIRQKSLMWPRKLSIQLI